MTSDAAPRPLYHWITLLILISSGPCMALMFTALGPVLPAIATHFATPSLDGALAAQLVMTMPGVGIIIGGWLTGWLGEKVGPRVLLLSMLLTFGLAGTGGAYVERIDLLLGLRLLVGIAACGVGTATLALISQRYHDAARARILGYQGGAGAFFGVASLLIAGRVAESGGWRAPFSLYGLGFILLVLAFMVRSQFRRGDVSTVQEDSSTHTSASSWQVIKVLWRTYLLIMIVMVAHFTNAVQIAFLLTADGTTSPVLQSIVLASSAITNASSSWSYGWVRDRIGGAWTFRIGLALMAIGYILIGVTSGIAFTATGSALAGIGSGVLLPHLLYLLLQKAPDELRTRAGGLFYTAVYLGDFMNPLVVAPVRMAFGIHGVFVVIGALIAAGVAYGYLPRQNSAAREA
ncbi:MAG: MFS transporter [Proteobacteria bacterium]|nr:MFS transporter [Pseudomonadota bacterium]HQR03068.1 MFS transporter [Rhodocyclaceae bacterium]